MTSAVFAPSGLNRPLLPGRVRANVPFAASASCGMLRKRRFIVRASAVAGASTQLSVLSSKSQVVQDHVLLTDESFSNACNEHKCDSSSSSWDDTADADHTHTAAVVSREMLGGLLQQPTGFAEGLKESALAVCVFDLETEETSDDRRINCIIHHALVQLGSVYASMVQGRISTEVDPVLAKDAAGMVFDARHLARLYKEVGVSPSRLLFKLPATWEGIQAVRILEAEGLQCHVADVYCFAQAAAALQAKASVVNVCVGRVRDALVTHHDAAGDVDPGLDLARRVHAYAKQIGSGTRLVAAGVRRPGDALALCGFDVLVLPPKVIAQLDSAPEDAGAVAYGPGLSPAEVASAHFSDEELAPVTRSSLEKALALGPAGELLAASIANKVKAGDRVREYLRRTNAVNM